MKKLLEPAMEKLRPPALGAVKPWRASEAKGSAPKGAGPLLYEELMSPDGVPLLTRRSMATILVIDDQEPVRRLLRTVLERAGHEVTEAPNGRLGLAAYRERPADLVITDILMPEMNGLDMILELTRAFLNVKVIAISGAPDTQNALDAAKLLGARHTLYKPFSLDALLKIVEYELAH